MRFNGMTGKRAVIVELMAHIDRPVRPTEIKTVTKMKCCNVVHMLLRMRTEGMAEQAPCGRWQLTALGKPEGGRAIYLTPPPLHVVE
jgi:hypothetical protein